ncbi:MAG: DUF3226 domain-containing protein [Janthinobacterium lividum]
MADQSLMLVEGDDDYHVFQHLLTTHSIDKQRSYRLESYGSSPRTSHPNEIVFRERQGFQNVREYLTQQLRITSDLKRLGIVVDADLDFAARWQSLRDVLVGAGYTNAPKQADPLGLILDHTETPDEKPRVGVWIMPNNHDTGSMEDFFALLLPSQDKLWERARLCVEQIPLEERLFKSAFIKAHVHTWLAWQERPGLPMGKAISEKYLNADASNAMHLMDWLRRLFDLSIETSPTTAA